MIIQSANIEFSHTHTLTETFTREERRLSQPSEQRNVDAATANTSPVESKNEDSYTSDSMQVDAKTFYLKLLVENLTGRKINLTESGLDVDDSEEKDIAVRSESPSALSNQPSQVFSVSESYFEAEASLFTASGEVRLASGEVININFSQYSERSFYTETNFELRVGEEEVVDPLVINFAGTGLSLTDDRYAFDLDNDGTDDNIVFATSGSAFLALDKNNNGTIDNGSELFGALTGNGFAELAQYDEDGNQFIDSGDSIFDQLQLLQKNADGSDSLFSVQDAGIGAFYLGSQDTPFQIKDQDNDLNALVRRSGVFLKEDGASGSMQHVDLVV